MSDFGDRVDVALGRVEMMRQELEAVARGEEPAVGWSVAWLYADWLTDIRDLLETLAR